MRAGAELQPGQQAQHRLLHLGRGDPRIELPLAQLGAMGESQRRELVDSDGQRARLGGRDREGERVFHPRRHADERRQLDLRQPAPAPLALQLVDRFQQRPLVVQRLDRRLHLAGRQTLAVGQRPAHV